MKSLEGKVAIVTGGSAGIGKATVIKFVAEGAKVAVWDINEERGKELETELNKDGHNITFYKVNTTDAEQINDATAKVIADFGKIDILVNNAGITKDSSAHGSQWLWSNHECVVCRRFVRKFWANKLCSYQSRSNRYVADVGKRTG